MITWTEHETQIKQWEHVKSLVYSTVKITRFDDHKTWPTNLFEKFMRCTKACGLCSCLCFSDWLEQANSNHTDSSESSQASTVLQGSDIPSTLPGLQPCLGLHQRWISPNHIQHLHGLRVPTLSHPRQTRSPAKNQQRLPQDPMFCVILSSAQTTCRPKEKGDIPFNLFQ